MKPVRQLSAMQASVTAADDAQIARIVALVDAMPRRGAADGLVAPLRPRLAKLRPPRPVGFTRLLFTPIDPLIVPPSAWRRGSLSVPRTALTPIAASLRALMAEEAAQIDAEGRAGMITQARLTELTGSIWPRAATGAERLELPLGWMEATGLPDGDFRPLTTLLAAVLGVALEIQGLMLRHDIPSEAGIRIILGRTTPRGPTALSAVLVVLLARLAGSGRIVALGTEASGSNPSKAVDAAVEHTLDTLQAAIDAESAIGLSLAQATQDTARIAELLQEFERSAATRPERKRRIDRLRRGADLLCRRRFETALQDELMARLTTLPDNPDDGTVENLEGCARDLRRLESHGRRLGGGDYYDALLRGCLKVFQRAVTPLRLEDRVRLVEILLGTKDAIPLLSENEAG